MKRDDGRTDGRARADDHERRNGRNTGCAGNTRRPIRADQGSLSCRSPGRHGDRWCRQAPRHATPRRSESSRDESRELYRTITTRTLGRHRCASAGAGESIRAPSTTRAVIGRAARKRTPAAAERARSELSREYGRARSRAMLRTDRGGRSRVPRVLAEHRCDEPHGEHGREKRDDDGSAQR